MHRRSGKESPYDFARKQGAYPVERVLAAAELASDRRAESIPELRRLLGDDDGGVRYWAARGLMMQGQKAVDAGRGELTKALQDSSPAVQVMAAEALASFSSGDDVQKAVARLLELADPTKEGAYVAVQSLNALDRLGPKAASVKEQIGRLPPKDPRVPERANGYVTRLVNHITKAGQ
jgi:hypothetical protein